MIGLDPDPAKYDPALKGVKLPTLADLLGLVSATAATALPDSLRQLPAIVVTELLVGFTTSPAQLQTLRFASNTASPWIIVPGSLRSEPGRGAGGGSAAPEAKAVRQDEAPTA